MSKSKEQMKFEALLGVDPKMQRLFRSKAEATFKLVYKYCTDVVKGKAKTSIKVKVPVDAKPGDEFTVEVPASLKDRNQAAKLLKELVWDKTVPDQRITGKEKDPGGKVAKSGAAEALRKLQEKDRLESEKRQKAAVGHA